MRAYEMPEIFYFQLSRFTPLFYVFVYLQGLLT